MRQSEEERRKEIKEIFAEKKPKAYRPPLPTKTPRTTRRGRSGRVKVLTEEQIFLHKLRNVKLPSGGI